MTPFVALSIGVLSLRSFHYSLLSAIVAIADPRRQTASGKEAGGSCPGGHRRAGSFLNPGPSRGITVVEAGLSPPSTFPHRTSGAAGEGGRGALLRKKRGELSCRSRMRAARSRCGRFAAA